MQHSDHDLRRQLRALPDPDPPAALRERVLTSHRHRQRAIRSVAGVSAIALLLAIVLPDLPGPQDASPPQPGLAATALPAHDAIARLRAIDRALQAAYERGASDDEVAPLWKARETLLAALPANQRPSS
ncbi:hypothetical protein [Marilutibacter alkalisoli]|uniref:Uncharacterized protein n=1 Tax=Marilutibacter alkalisoli TaxID=2591633 RepID=A0A514BPP5_9GAMM|nr:hypothetical protein [Lysobacter alkalisoli]QDH69351.1 hypothetical protein FKV23_03985 [Lysobacter alkalisoli]